MERLVSIFLWLCLMAGAGYGWLVTGRVLAAAVGAVVFGLAGLVLAALLSVSVELVRRPRRPGGGAT